MTGLLRHPKYDCPICIQFENCASRNCTGGQVIYVGNNAYVDPANLPRPVANPTRPAYPNGWADVAKDAAEAGIRHFDKAFDGPDYFDPMDHCIRLSLAQHGVADWLRLYSAIQAGIRRAPDDTLEFYDRIMLGIHNAVLSQREALNG